MADVEKGRAPPAYHSAPYTTPYTTPYYEASAAQTPTTPLLPSVIAVNGVAPKKEKMDSKLVVEIFWLVMMGFLFLWYGTNITVASLYLYELCNATTQYITVWTIIFGVLGTVLSILGFIEHFRRYYIIKRNLKNVDTYVAKINVFWFIVLIVDLISSLTILSEIDLNLNDGCGYIVTLFPVLRLSVIAAGIAAFICTGLIYRVASVATKS